MKNWGDIQRATNAEILSWAGEQPWARTMAACLQDAGWHAEGDVWTHTLMVCQELEQLAEWSSLERSEQLKMLFTALFHDSGKPATSVLDPESGKIRSPKHALVGMAIGRNVLRELGSPLPLREEVAALIRFHGRPPFLLEKGQPEQQVISTSCLLSNRLLYLFSLADFRGRKSPASARSEDTLHLWKLVAEECGCYECPYPFANDQARFLFYREKLSSLHYVPQEDYRCVVTMMSGLPGAGKDTWLSRFRPGLAVVSLDEIRSNLDVEATDNQGEVIQTAREQCRGHLRAGINFVFNATNITRLMRQRWINLFADYSARIEIVYLEPPLTTILDQNRRRDRQVPESVIRRLMDKTDPPTLDEAHAVHFDDGTQRGTELAVNRGAPPSRRQATSVK